MERILISSNTIRLRSPIIDYDDDVGWNKRVLGMSKS